MHSSGECDPLSGKSLSPAPRSHRVKLRRMLGEDVAFDNLELLESLLCRTDSGLAGVAPCAR